VSVSEIARSVAELGVLGPTPRETLHDIRVARFAARCHPVRGFEGGEAVTPQLGRADRLLPTPGQRLCALDRGQFLRQPDTAAIRTGSVAIFTRFCLRRSIASHGTIAKLVGAAGAARSAAQNL